MQYVYGVRHEWLPFLARAEDARLGRTTEAEKEVLQIHRQANYRDRPTWLTLGGLLAAEVWDSKSERRMRERHRYGRRAADREPS